MFSYVRIVAVLVSAFVVSACDSQGLWLQLAPKEAADESSDQVYPYEPLAIETQTGIETFRVEVVADDDSRRRGLMFRTQMPEDAGMLFDFEGERHISMWMKNTYLSLDMLFISSDGTIVRIAENTVPESLDSIRSGVPVLSVLELNAGTATRLGIAVGDVVQHPLFGFTPSP